MTQRLNTFLLTSIDWAGRCKGSCNFLAPRRLILFRFLPVTGNTQKVQSCPKALNDYAPSQVNKRDRRLLRFLRNCVSSYSVAREDRYQLVRPLLCLNRCDVMKFCQNWCLPVYPDITNERLQFLRNKLRKQLIPLLRYSFNPQFDKNLFQSSQLFLHEQLRTEKALLKLYSLKDTVNHSDLVITKLRDSHPEGQRVLILFVSKSNMQLIFNSHYPSLFLISTKNNSTAGSTPLPFYKGFKDVKTFSTLKQDIHQSTTKYHYLFLPEIGSCFLFKH